MIFYSQSNTIFLFIGSEYFVLESKQHNSTDIRFELLGHKSGHLLSNRYKFVVQDYEHFGPKMAFYKVLDKY